MDFLGYTRNGYSPKQKSHASICCLHGIISAVLCDTLPICAQELFETVHLIVPSHDGDDIIGIELKGRGDICGHLVTVLHGDDVQAVSLAEIQRLYRHAFHRFRQADFRDADVVAQGDVLHDPAQAGGSPDERPYPAPDR